MSSPNTKLNPKILSSMEIQRKIKNGNNDKKVFKSPNLEAERRRREKVHNLLMTLRSLVPIITNMKKATIVEDAITYIKNLQTEVECLSENILHETIDEAPEIINNKTRQIVDFKQENIKEHIIQEVVEVSKVGENNYWLKIITENKNGIFTKLMELMSFIGFEIVDISLTTFNESILISSYVQVVYGVSVDVEETQNLLLEILRKNP